jgi:hypothetical protein
MGINLGDVIKDGDDISGDGVNVAARLEPLAPLDGICISGAVRDQVREDLGIVLEDLGDQKVRNIARPIRAYRIFVNPTIHTSSLNIRWWKQNRPRLITMFNRHRKGIFVQIALVLSMLTFIWIVNTVLERWPSKINVATEETIRSAATSAGIPLPSRISFSHSSFAIPYKFAKYLGAWSSGDSRFNGKGRMRCYLQKPLTETDQWRGIGEKVVQMNLLLISCRRTLSKWLET